MENLLETTGKETATFFETQYVFKGAKKTGTSNSFFFKSIDGARLLVYTRPTGAKPDMKQCTLHFGPVHSQNTDQLEKVTLSKLGKIESEIVIMLTQLI